MADRRAKLSHAWNEAPPARVLQLYIVSCAAREEYYIESETEMLHCVPCPPAHLETKHAEALHFLFACI